MSRALSPRWAPPPSRPLVLGHRGARHAAPENTFAAFDLALAEGADGVELDVRLNASGDVVVCHDVTLERVTEGRDTRTIHQLTSSECRSIRLSRDEPLPFLRDVLDWAEQNHACLNVELKVDGRRRSELVLAVARLTSERAAADNVLISCFNPVVLLVHATLAPDIPTAWLVDSRRLAAWPILTWTGNAALHPKHSLITAASISVWRRQSRRIHAWTVNDPARACELAALGVDCLITDNPGTLLSALVPAARMADPDARRGELAK